MSQLILIVDDLLDCATPLKHLLNAAGYRAECVGSAPAALDFLTNQRPDLIILDNQMPMITGAELLRHLHGASATADIPVAMYSASDAPDDMDLYRRLGAADVICKGRIDAEDLLLRLRALLAPRPTADAA